MHAQGSHLGDPLDSGARNRLPLYRDRKCCEKKSRKRLFFPSLFTDVNRSNPAKNSSGQSLRIQKLTDNDLAYQQIRSILHMVSNARST